MNDEIVPIVDEDNNRLSEVSKVKAHEEGILHPTVICEIKDSKGRYCFVKQSGYKQDAGAFVSPVGGHVEASESDEEAMKREVEEEVGYTGFDFEFKGSIMFDRQVISRHEKHLFLVYEVYCDDDPILNDESVEFRWFTVEELRTSLKESPEMFGEAFWVVVKNLYPEWVGE
jgi:isopentenyl-diphosphate delta-isomerase